MILAQKQVCGDKTFWWYEDFVNEQAGQLDKQIPNQTHKWINTEQECI